MVQRGGRLAGADDGLVTVRPLLSRIGDVADVLREDRDPEAASRLRAAETTGRPLGNAAFIADLERRLGRKLAKGRPGPARKLAADGQQALWGWVSCP